MIRKNDIFIATRLAKSTKGKSVMVRVATLSVAISITVMIIAISVIIGFRNEIEKKISGFGSTFQIVALNGGGKSAYPIELSETLLKQVGSVDGVSSIFPFAQCGAIIKSQEAMMGVGMRGFDGQFNTAFFEQSLVEGTMPPFGSEIRTKDILISQTIATTLDVGVEDRLEVMIVDPAGRLRRDRFKVSGIYDSGFEEMDVATVLTDMRNVQRLNGWDSLGVSGYDVIASGGDMERMEEEIYHIAERDSFDSDPLMVLSVAARYPSIFDWLLTHKINGLVVLVIMLLVAFLNMTCSLLIILLEQTHVIGILKAMGMRDRVIELIFTIRSSMIIFKGLVIGNLFSLVLIFVQGHFKIISLDPKNYYIDSVPTDFGWWIVLLNICVITVLTLLLLLPAKIVTRFKPEKSLRYQ